MLGVMPIGLGPILIYINRSNKSWETYTVYYRWKLREQSKWKSIEILHFIL